MIRSLKTLCIGLLFLLKLNAQESLFWEVADPIVNSEFIESYINRLIEVDKFEENAIQASFSIIVQMDIDDDLIELKKLKAKDYQMGQYISFDMSEVNKMDPDQINTIMSRQYKWKDVSSQDLTELEEYSTVDNVFKERSFKDARDAFWWSNSQISASIPIDFSDNLGMRIYIRQKSGNLAFRLEQGFPDLGLSRQLSENLTLGLSNDIVSTYLILPGNTYSVSKGIGHPLEGNFGFGFKFDTHKLGGQINFMDIEFQEYDYQKIFSRKHIVIPANSGVLYWSNTFQINRKVDSKYGLKIKDQKKNKKQAEKIVSKNKNWLIDNKNYDGLFLNVDDNNFVTIQVAKDKDAHKNANKPREWTTSSGSIVNATLVERNKNSITLKRSNDGFSLELKINDLSKEDQDLLESLQWDGEKTIQVSLESLSTEDQQIIKSATSVVRERSGKNKELKISQPYGSMRLKAGLSFTQFSHASVDTVNQVMVSDRVTGTDAIGLYAKVEGVTDDKNSKAYFQINVSGSGFKSFSFGIDHNVYRMINLGMDCFLYPNNSFVEFNDQREDQSSKWKWYPGSEPDNGEGGGTFMISPYISVNF
tara:strand:+ start:2371 stop:4140 length:1770 start_codon:yes stop_codon:yes gene_type:complete